MNLKRFYDKSIFLISYFCSLLGCFYFVTKTFLFNITLPVPSVIFII